MRITIPADTRGKLLDVRVLLDAADLLELQRSRQPHVVTTVLDDGGRVRVEVAYRNEVELQPEIPVEAEPEKATDRAAISAVSLGIVPAASRGAR